MRTHLLRTFYPAPATEPDTGCAANDASYGPRKTAATLSTGVAAASTAPREDETYQLGGYAGI